MDITMRDSFRKIGGEIMELKENFFEKEVRCGFEVSKMMKRAWAAEIDLLTILLEVCDKYNIQCYADSGTLLGAVRHKGFIPWDDDIDMTVKREEYTDLIKILRNELPKGIYVRAGKKLIIK